MPKRKNQKAKNKGGRNKGVRSPKIYSFKADGVKYWLTRLQKRFCDFFLKFDCNGPDAVIEAGYKCTYPNSKSINRGLACSIASENLKKPAIIAYISKRLDEIGLNDAEVDKHLLYNVRQFSNLHAKNKAIEIYNKQKGRFAPEEHKHKIETIEVVKYGKQDKTSS